jgi:hypothetical protein
LTNWVNYVLFWTVERNWCKELGHWVDENDGGRDGHGRGSFKAGNFSTVDCQNDGVPLTASWNANNKVGLWWLPLSLSQEI